MFLSDPPIFGMDEGDLRVVRGLLIFGAITDQLHLASLFFTSCLISSSLAAFLRFALATG